jgi:glycosyltransferase involved in cell wall biosynthesis
VTPRVSILMLTYNRPQCIGRAIDSICGQTYQDWELIIVQDGSNSETAGLLEHRLATDARIRYFPRGVVGSIAEASNAGLKMARGEYIAILDDDDAWSFPEKLALQVDFLDRHPEYVACGGGYIIVDQDGREQGRYLKRETDSAIRSRALLANPMVNSTCLFRRIADGSPVFYNASVRQFADWDFWLTLGAMGKLYNFPRYLACYALWEGGSSFRHQRENARAAIHIVCKHRRHYTGFGFALLLSSLYFGYAYLPLWLRRATYSSLSSLKKALAGSRR